MSDESDMGSSQNVLVKSRDADECYPWKYLHSCEILCRIVGYLWDLFRRFSAMNEKGKYEQNRSGKFYIHTAHCYDFHKSGETIGDIAQRQMKRLERKYAITAPCSPYPPIRAQICCDPIEGKLLEYKCYDSERKNIFLATSVYLFLSHDQYLSVVGRVTKTVNYSGANRQPQNVWEHIAVLERYSQCPDYACVAIFVLYPMSIQSAKNVYE